MRMQTCCVLLILLLKPVRAYHRSSSHARGLGRTRRTLVENSDNRIGNSNNTTANTTGGNREVDWYNDDMTGNATNILPSASPGAIPSTWPVQLASPSPSPTLKPVTIAEVVDLQGFVVVVVDNSTFQDLKNTLETYFTEKLRQQFQSLISIDLKSEGQTFSGKDHEARLAFSGNAAFASPVSDQLVRNAQIQLLQDIESVRQVIPNLKAIVVEADSSNNGSSVTTSSEQLPSGFMAVLVVGVLLGFLVALFFAYRYFCFIPPRPHHHHHHHNTQPPPRRILKKDCWRTSNRMITKWSSSRILRIPETAIPLQETAPPDKVSRTSSCAMNEDLSLEQISAAMEVADVGGGVEPTLPYLATQIEEVQCEQLKLSQKPEGTTADGMTEAFRMNQSGKNEIEFGREEDLGSSRLEQISNGNVAMGRHRSIGESFGDTDSSTLFGGMSFGLSSDRGSLEPSPGVEVVMGGHTFVRERHCDTDSSTLFGGLSFGLSSNPDSTLPENDAPLVHSKNDERVPPLSNVTSNGALIEAKNSGEIEDAWEDELPMTSSSVSV